MIVKNIKWIMLFFGVITCTTFFAVITPQDALLNMFGSNLTEPLANLLVRSWGFLVFIMGALLIYGAFNEETPDWLSFFMFTYFTDRDGKFQLSSLSDSAFDPLSRSC